MKIEIKEKLTLDKKIEIKPYLTYAEIQNIVNVVGKLTNWSERETNIDILALFYATNLTKEEIEEMGHDTLLECGLIEELRKTVKNFEQIREGIKYNESIERNLAKIIDELPKIVESSFNKVRKNATASKK